MKHRIKFNWSLSRKGLLYISVILLVQLIFFAWLGHLLKQQEFIADKEYHSKQVFGHANWLAALMSTSILGTVGYAIDKDDGSLELSKWCRKRVPAELAQLLETVSHNPNQKRQAEVIASTWPEIEKTLDRERAETAKGLDPNSQVSNKEPPSLVRNEPVLKEQFMKLVNARHELNYEERTRFDAEHESPTEYRNKQKNTLVAGVAISILGAIFTFAQFSKGITKRIDVLTVNSLRLAQGEQLKPVIPGSDEIALLDQTFHDMADALTKAKNQLEASQSRLLTLIDNMPVGILAVDALGTIEFANPSAKAIFGNLDPAGSTLQAILSLTTEKIESILNSKTQARVEEVEFTDSENKSRAIEISTREITLTDGERKLIMLQDVTERHELERMKQEFVSMVSHDLRTPLSSISLFLHLVQRLPEDSMPEQIKDNLQIADRNTKRLLNLVNDLLDIEKLQAGKLPMNFGYHDAESLLAESVDALKVLAESRSITLDMHAQNFEIVADGERLIQVLVNLLANAVKFSPDGSIVTATVEEQAELAVFQIIDQGRGIAPENRQSVFEKYKQVKRSDSARGAGTGLGLPICKAIVEEHGGTIGVDGGPERGSIFWVKIPKRRAEG